MNMKEKTPCIDEKGRGKNGEDVFFNRRLFMQLRVMKGVVDPTILASAVKRAKIDGVLYQSIRSPKEIGFLTFNEDADFFVRDLRKLMISRPFSDFPINDDYTMFGRTYSMGYESDLENYLLRKPRQRALNPDWPWAIWYPLRRAGTFHQLDIKEQKEILREHGTIGFSFGKADYAHDIRLACHGLDKNDNDFVIGIVGKDLYPLSALVETMRKTKQTSTYLEKLGPFFIGKAIWQSTF